MDDVIIDTNIVIWYFSQLSLPSVYAQTSIDKALRNGNIFVATVTIVELTYLVEKNKIPLDVLTAVLNALDDPSSALQIIELTRDISETISKIPRSVVPDMPDRMIAATALHLGVPLITSDSDIRKLKNIKTIW